MSIIYGGGACDGCGSDRMGYWCNHCGELVCACEPHDCAADEWDADDEREFEDFAYPQER